VHKEVDDRRGRNRDERADDSAERSSNEAATNTSKGWISRWSPSTTGEIRYPCRFWITIEAAKVRRNMRTSASAALECGSRAAGL
jgi:hypothetical protein